MSSRPPDDDPTHALDAFVRRMRATPAPTPADDPTTLASLASRSQPGRAAGGARPKGGTLRSGLAWDADDVVDVPEIALPPVPAPAPMDAVALDAALQQAGARAAADFTAQDLAAAAPAWQPDLQALQALQLRPATHPRLLRQWQPGAWTGALRELLAAATEIVNTPAGTVVQSYPAQHLLLLWPPQRLDAPLLGRWPQQLQWLDGPSDQSTEAMLAALPAQALLWLLPDAQAVDWALAAEIVLTHQPTLRPFQADALRGFIAAEREAGFARLNSRYQAAPGGARQA